MIVAIVASIGIAPLVLALIGLIFSATSTAEGRFGALLVFGFTTFTMSMLIIAMALQGREEWKTALLVIAGTDLLVLAIALIQKKRKIENG